MIIIHDGANGSEERTVTDEDERDSISLTLSGLGVSRNVKASNLNGIDNECIHNGPAKTQQEAISSARDKSSLCHVHIGQGDARNTPIFGSKETLPSTTIATVHIQKKKNCYGEINNIHDQEEVVTISTTGTSTTNINTNNINSNKTNQDDFATSMEPQSCYIPQDLHAKKTSAGYATPVATQSNCFTDGREKQDISTSNDVLVANAEENNHKLRNRISKLKEAIKSIRTFESIKKGQRMVKEYGLKVELEGLQEDLRFLEAKHEGLSETLFELHLQRLDLIRLEEEQQQEEEEQQEEEKASRIQYSKRDLEGRSNSISRNTTFRSTISNVSE
uniref:Uncharacterized protein n=1 Tax=Pseudo-nitzschia australis TaxID=44445 RepID=A0A7S4AWY5_9STRA|mmetsp:Transcript_24858/g.54594  ORF Transcript_24858/g.54594 Transcript_24858/m.54594 type:complete len:333 (+) Transcript_24858:135-1133(+)|eukprot:CAMPEP_0168169506 /NCGR_PEP_ID=MMETSP0139_2-20121125/3677_1 /TAXON_ID=44445 /ORGANISM="Pseudo-nitzschia australis, Strain 10249 10 AB" /LENGTH=332 /DNA_ID=CAMNT_0008086935 /DNA_START=107 /DNA_END=1105 /DNA_ORIENTATION=-